MKYTKGPWEWNDNLLNISDGIIEIFEPNDEDGVFSIADVYRHARSNIETRANACLIAAAPDLLEACELMIKSFKKSSGVPISLNEAYFNMKQAIAKTQGK